MRETHSINVGGWSEDVDPTTHSLSIDLTTKLDLINDLIVREHAKFILEDSAFHKLNLLYGVGTLEYYSCITFSNYIIPSIRVDVTLFLNHFLFFL